MAPLPLLQCVVVFKTSREFHGAIISAISSLPTKRHRRHRQHEPQAANYFLHGHPRSSGTFNFTLQRACLVAKILHKQIAAPRFVSDFSTEVAAVGIEWIVGFFGGPVVLGHLRNQRFTLPNGTLDFGCRPRSQDVGLHTEHGSNLPTHPRWPTRDFIADNTPPCMLQSALGRSDLLEGVEDIPTVHKSI